MLAECVCVDGRGRMCVCVCVGGGDWLHVNSVIGSVI